MSIVREIKCNVCGNFSKEEKLGDGWSGWGELKGKLGPKGEEIFALCPDDLEKVFGYIQNLMGE